MKKKRIVLIVIAIIAIILAFIGGQSYAKYMSKVTGQGTADIASWSFKVNENQEQMQSISLRSTINNSKLLNNKIAPGTEGSFEIKLDATGADVGINYGIKFENETTKPANLKFIYNGNTYATLALLQNVLTGTINADEYSNSDTKEKIKTLQIGWKWEYETGGTANEIKTNDDIDTQNAKSIRNYTFDIIVSGTQVTPNN